MVHQLLSRAGSGNQLKIPDAASDESDDHAATNPTGVLSRFEHGLALRKQPGTSPKPASVSRLPESATGVPPVILIKHFPIVASFRTSMYLALVACAVSPFDSMGKELDAANDLLNNRFNPCAIPQCAKAAGFVASAVGLLLLLDLATPQFADHGLSKVLTRAMSETNQIRIRAGNLRW